MALPANRPSPLPPYRLVNYYYNEWTDNRTLEKANTALRQHLREKSRNPDRHDGSHHWESKHQGDPKILSGIRVRYGGKFVKGRKSNILVDTWTGFPGFHVLPRASTCFHVLPSSMGGCKEPLLG